MSIGPITKDLIRCINGDSLDSQKFFSMHPLTKELEVKLYDLRNKGYLVIDEGDSRIIEIDATSKLVDLAKANQ